MTARHDLEERIFGLIVGVGIGVVIGFLLRQRGRRERAGRADQASLRAHSGS